MTLTLTHDFYHVTFPPDEQNAAVWIVIRADAPHPYQAVQETEIPPAKDGVEPTAVDIPRRALPKGASYYIEADLLQWRDGYKGYPELVAVDSCSTEIHIP